MRSFLIVFMIFSFHLADEDPVVVKNQHSFQTKSYISNLSINDLLMNQDSLDIEELFESYLFEAKLLLAESVIADLTGDTLGAKFQFDLLFETLSNIDAIETKDEFQELEMNILTSSTFGSNLN